MVTFSVQADGPAWQLLVALRPPREACNTPGTAQGQYIFCFVAGEDGRVKTCDIVREGGVGFRGGTGAWGVGSSAPPELQGAGLTLLNPCRSPPGMTAERS